MVLRKGESFLVRSPIKKSCSVKEERETGRSPCENGRGDVRGEFESDGKEKQEGGGMEEGDIK